MEFYKLILRNLLQHPLRSLLTTASLVVALFLLCTLRTLVTTLEAGAKVAGSNRLWVQSAVSLFVDMPLHYPEKIEAVDGVERACKWQWFGGYYQDPGNFFAQFAVDAERMLDMYPEVQIVEGSREAFLGRRTGCMIGTSLQRDFGWEVGDTVPIIGALFPHPDGADKAWEFEVMAVYESTQPNFDERTLFFHWKLFEETLEDTAPDSLGVGAIVIESAPGVDQTRVMAEIDSMFENGPQRVQTTTEAEFQAQFVSMFGNVPFFVASIGGGVLLAILLACVNTMLMSAREQTVHIGIMKALGFTDARMFVLLITQSLVICGIGGGLGILVALGAQGALEAAMGAMLPGFRILPETIVLAVLATLGIGLFAGIVPALRASRLQPVAALSGRE